MVSAPPWSTGQQGCVPLLGSGGHLFEQVAHRAVKCAGAGLLVGPDTMLCEISAKVGHGAQQACGYTGKFWPR